MSLPRPTDAELILLKVLWDRGPSTVRQVFEVLSENRDLAYTTVLKTLQVMTDKGLVERDETTRSHVYQTTASEAQTQNSLMQDLVDRAFGGTAMRLVQAALSRKKVSKSEMAAIRSLLDRPGGGEP